MANNQQTLELLIKAKQETDATFKRLIDNLEEAEKKAKATTSGFGSMRAGLAEFTSMGPSAGAALQYIGTAGAAAAGAVAAVGAAFVALGNRGADVNDIRQQFQLLQQEIGNSSAVLGKLDTAFAGTVSEFDIMKATNQALSQGLKLTEDQFVTTADASRVLADRIGGDAKDAYEALTMAMATGQDRMLKQVGLNIDGAAAVEKMAASLGVETSALTENQQIQAKRLAILEEMNNVLAVSGKAEVDFADRIKQGQAAVQNLVDELGSMIASSDTVNTAMAGLSDIFMNLVATIDQNKEAIVGWVEHGVIMAVDGLSLLVSGVSYAIDIFDALRLTWKSAAEIGLSLAIAQNELAAAAAFVAGATEEELAVYDKTAVKLTSLREQYRQEADELVTANTKKQNAISEFQGQIDKLSSKLKEEKTAHEETGQAGLQMGANVKAGAATAKGGVDQLAGSSKAAAEEAKRLADAWKKYNDQINELHGVGPTLEELGTTRRDVDEANALQNAKNILAQSQAGGYGAEMIMPGLVKSFQAVGPKLGDTIKTALNASLKDLPSVILGAIQGGGNVGAAIGAQLGGAITKPLGDTVGKGLSKVLGSSLGAGIGSIVPGLGTLLGGALGGFVGKGLGKLVGGIFGGGEKGKVKDMRKQFIEAAGGIDELKRKAAEAGVSLDKMFSATKIKDFESAVKGINGAFNLQQQSQEALNSAVEKYGFTVDELGPKWRQQELDKMAAGLLQDYQLLTASGIEHNTVIEKMAPSLNEYVQSAIAAGIAIPENMRPALEKMLEMGLLTDEAGNKMDSLDGLNFTESLTEGLKSAVDAIRDLVAALTGIPRETNVNVNVRTNRSGGDVPGGDNGGYGGGYKDPDGIESNAFGGISTGPSLRLTHGTPSNPEIIAPVREMSESIGAGLAQQLMAQGMVPGGGAPAAGGGMPPIFIQIGPQAIDDFIARRMENGYIPRR